MRELGGALKIVVCDGCGDVLVDKRRKIYERYDVVALEAGKPKDICQKCYPHFVRFKREKTEFAIERLRELRAFEQEMETRLWEEVRAQRGIQTTPEGNSAETARE